MTLIYYYSWLYFDFERKKISESRQRTAESERVRVQSFHLTRYHTQIGHFLSFEAKQFAIRSEFFLLLSGYGGGQLWAAKKDCQRQTSECPKSINHTSWTGAEAAVKTMENDGEKKTTSEWKTDRV